MGFTVSLLAVDCASGVHIFESAAKKVLGVENVHHIWVHICDSGTEIDPSIVRSAFIMLFALA